MEALAYAHETDGDLNTFCFLDATFASRQDGKVIIVSTEKKQFPQWKLEISTQMFVTQNFLNVGLK